MTGILYTKYFKRSVKIIIIILILISSIFVTGSNLFQNSLLSVSEKFGYLRYAHLLLIDFDNLRNEFNFKKLSNNRSFSYLKHQVKIDFSYDDITALSQSYRIGLKNGYLVDSEKKWRKINITIGQQEFKNVKIKIHGTSLTPFANSLGLIGNYNLNKNTSKKIGSSPATVSSVCISCTTCCKQPRSASGSPRDEPLGRESLAPFPWLGPTLNM